MDKLDNGFFGDYGFFSLEPKNEIGNPAVIKIKGHEDKLIYHYGNNSIKVVILDPNHVLLSTIYSNIFIAKGEKGVTLSEFSFEYKLDREEYDEIYNNTIMFHAIEEIEQAPYKMTDNLLAYGLVIIRFGQQYFLYDFVNNKFVSKGFSNIDEVNGELIAEYAIYTSRENDDYGRSVFTYPGDILVGMLNFDGTVKNDMLLSQKYNLPIKISSLVEEDYAKATQGFNDLYPNQEFDYKNYLENKGGGRK